MIDYKNIVKEMVDNNSTKSGASIEYKGIWYFVVVEVINSVDLINEDVNLKEK